MADDYLDRRCALPSAAAIVPEARNPITRHDSRREHYGDGKVTRGLGWLSLGLSSPALLTPQEFGRPSGSATPPGTGPLRWSSGCRTRAGVGLLGRQSPAWLWYRVGGDLIHIGMLGRAPKNHDGRGLPRTAVAFAAVVGITGVDVYAAVTRSRGKVEMDTSGTTTVGPAGPGGLRHVAAPGQAA